MIYKTEEIIGVFHDLMVLEDNSTIDDRSTLFELIERRNKVLREFHLAEREK